MQAQHTQVRAGERRQSQPKDTPTKLRDTCQIVSTAQGQQRNVRHNESGELNAMNLTVVRMLRHRMVYVI